MDDKQIILETTNNWKVVNEGYLRTFLGMSLFTPAGWVLWRLINSKFDKCYKHCGTLDFGPRRDACMLICRIDRLEGEIKSLQKNKSNCKDLRKPDKCKNKIDKAIKRRKDLLNKYKRKLIELKRKRVSEGVEPTNEIVGVMAASAILAGAITSGMKIYRNYLSKAARQCSGFSGEQKQACMRKNEIRAISAQIATISRNKSLCSKADNPLKCKNKLDNQIYKLKLKIRAIKEKAEQYA